MSNSYDRGVEEANGEFLQAVDELEQLANRLRAKKSVPGKKIVCAPLNDEYFEELRRAEAKVAETDRKLEEAVKRWRAEGQRT